MTAWEPSPARPYGRFDLYLALAILIVSAMTAALYLPTFRAAGGKAQFYQPDFAPAVMWACGRGYVNVPSRTAPALDAFLATRADTFNCADLPAQVRTVGLGLMPSVCRYLMLATAGVWRATGVSWARVDILLVAMFSVAISAAFCALRFVAGRPLAALGALCWTISPMHLSNLPHLRDYAKTPFFALTAVAAAVVITERRAVVLILTGVAFGVIEGIGFGMRTDVAVNFIPFFVALFFAGPRGFRDQIGPKVGAAIAAVLMFTAVAQPLFGVYGTSNGLSSVALEGLTASFDPALSVRPAPYSFGALYDDSFTASQVRGDWMRHHDGPPTLGASREYYVRLLTRVPGDMLTRAAGSTISTLNLPFSITYGRAPWGVTNRALTALGDLRARLALAFFGTGPFAAALLLFILGSSRPRDAAAGAAILLFTAAYPVIQFHGRHTFHLEFLVIGLLVWLASLLARSGREIAMGNRPGAPALARSLGVVAGTVALAIVAIVTARLLQGPQTRAMLARYESSTVDALSLARSPAGDGQVRLSTDAFPPRPNREFQQVFLVADVSTVSCGAAPKALTLRYLDQDLRTPVEYDFTTRVALPNALDQSPPTRVFFAAYAFSTRDDRRVGFVGVDVPAGSEGCVRLSRVRGGLDDELWLDATLVPGWRERPLYQRLYLAPLVPERAWLKIARWWPSLAALG